MNNVFADFWRIADTDANVDYRVKYIAEAWHQRNIRDCAAFSKRRFMFGTIVQGNLYESDCIRLKLLRNHSDDLFANFRIVAAALSVPVFAAPLPGDRLSTHDFWAKQEARIAILKENLRLKRQGSLFTGITP
jgi:hypothetical protein